MSDAHPAITPLDFRRPPDDLKREGWSADRVRLYALLRKMALASFAPPLITVTWNYDARPSRLYEVNAFRPLTKREKLLGNVFDYAIRGLLLFDLAIAALFMYGAFAHYLTFTFALFVASTAMLAYRDISSAASLDCPGNLSLPYFWFVVAGLTSIGAIGLGGADVLAIATSLLCGVGAASYWHSS